MWMIYITRYLHIACVKITTAESSSIRVNTLSITSLSESRHLYVPLKSSSLRVPMLLRTMVRPSASLQYKYNSVKVHSYVARYRVLGTAQRVQPFNPWQTCSFQRYLNFSGKHSAMLQLLHGDYSFTYPPLSVS